MARDFASCCSSSGTSPKNRYNNIINIHTVVEIRKGKQIKKKLQDKETITRYCIVYYNIFCGLKIKTKDIIILNHEFNIIECIG